MRQKKTKKVFVAESLNPEKSISMTMRNIKDTRYAVCLCLPNRMVKTVFPSISGAINQMSKYRNLYKKLEDK